jgi:hypothetical protein
MRLNGDRRRIGGGNRRSDQLLLAEASGKITFDRVGKAAHRHGPDAVSLGKPVAIAEDMEPRLLIKVDPN